MAIQVLHVPYDFGHRDRRMGHGPIHLLERGVIERLQRIDVDVQLTPVEIATSFPTEIGTAFELHRKVAQVVATTVQGGGTLSFYLETATVQLALLQVSVLLIPAHQSASCGSMDTGIATRPKRLLAISSMPWV